MFRNKNVGLGARALGKNKIHWYITFLSTTYFLFTFLYVFSKSGFQWSGFCWSRYLIQWGDKVIKWEEHTWAGLNMAFGDNSSEPDP